ncbi:MAG: endonuclease V [Thermoplasmatota archaeon]
MDLYQDIIELADQVPHGAVTTPEAIAEALGDHRAARAVQRVLTHAGRGDCIVAMGSAAGRELFTDFAGQAPLQRLRAEQQRLRDAVVISDDFDEIATIAGVDVAYQGQTAYGAYVEMDMDGEVTAIKAIQMETRFPYISTYLSYRELPVLEVLLDGETPSLVMVDGNGILHPYGFGLASHVGVLHDLPVIGVAKSLLCGEICNRYVYLNGRRTAVCCGTNNPVYVSPGHRISLETAASITEHGCRHRIPEPIRRAHMLAGQTKRRALPENDE